MKSFTYIFHTSLFIEKNTIPLLLFYLVQRRLL